MLKDSDIYPVLLALLNTEKQTARLYAEAQQSSQHNRLKEMFKELEQCSRHHHGIIYDYLQQSPAMEDCQWLKVLLWVEQQNHCLYNSLLNQIFNPSIRQMLKELRDGKMRCITLLQDKLSQWDDH